MNWLKGLGVILLAGVGGAIALPMLGLVQNVMDAFIFIAGLALLVIAVIELPEIIGRGHRTKKGNYSLEKVKKV